MIKACDVYKAGVEQLASIEVSLIIEKMKLDKFFSTLLNHDFDESDTTTNEWFTYKEMIKEYDRVSRLLATVRYRISNV